MVVNYQNGKIYRIIADGENYIGSTTLSLSKRLAKHRSHLKEYQKTGKGGNITSYPLLERGDCVIILIENVPCDNKEELLKRERYFIETMDCVNKVIPLRTKAEYNEDNKDKFKEYNNKYNQEHKNERNEWIYINKDRRNHRRRELRKLKKEMKPNSEVNNI